MGFKTDIEIAQECTMEPITKIAEKAGIDDKYLEQYGKYKAKIDYNLLNESDAPNGKLILVTAINPTPAGEGKTYQRTHVWTIKAGKTTLQVESSRFQSVHLNFVLGTLLNHITSHNEKINHLLSPDPHGREHGTLCPRQKGKAQ